jgi:hypothetical protein
MSSESSSASSSTQKTYEKVRVFVMRKQWEEQGVGTLSMFLDGDLYQLQVEGTTLRQPVDWKEGLLPAMAVEGQENRAFVMPAAEVAGSPSSGELCLLVCAFPVPSASLCVPLTPCLFATAPLRPCLRREKNSCPCNTLQNCCSGQGVSGGVHTEGGFQ